MTKLKGADPARLWESYIREECKHLAKRKFTDARKNWEAPKVPGSHVSVEPSAPDFGGCAVINGVPRSVLFEAKYTELENRLPIKNISEQQIHDLLWRVDLGGIAFVYVCNKNNDKFIVPVIDNANCFFPTRREYISKRGGSILLKKELQKKEGETWLDFVERNTDKDGQWII